jgi:hypothetical protein
MVLVHKRVHARGVRGSVFGPVVVVGGWCVTGSLLGGSHRIGGGRLRAGLGGQASGGEKGSNFSSSNIS